MVLLLRAVLQPIGWDRDTLRYEGVACTPAGALLNCMGLLAVAAVDLLTAVCG